MSLNNKIKQQGFTIVELLIVIVVIGILAAITIVAYNGVQNRAKTTNAQSAATNTSKKAEIYNTENASYPTTFAAMATGQSGKTWELTGVNQLTAVPTTAPSNASSVLYYTCSTTTPAASGVGFQIKYWDYATNAVSTTVLSGGNTSGTCTLATT